LRTTVPHISHTSLRSLRGRANLTQGELASLLGVQKSYICHLEKNRRPFTSIMRWALFSILGSFEREDYKEVSPWLVEDL